MSDKNDPYSTRRVPFDEMTRSEDKWQDGQRGWEWHLEFRYSPDYPYRFDCANGNTRQARRRWASCGGRQGVRLQYGNHRVAGTRWFASTCAEAWNQTLMTILREASRYSSQ